MLYTLGEHRVELRGDHHFVAPDATIIGRVILEHGHCRCRNIHVYPVASELSWQPAPALHVGNDLIDTAGYGHIERRSGLDRNDAGRLDAVAPLRSSHRLQ